MSRASKITLAATITSCVGTVLWVHYIQNAERNLLHQGPIKDAKRMELKKKQLFNKKEHEEQLALREQYEKIQPLSGDNKE